MLIGFYAARYSAVLKRKATTMKTITAIAAKRLGKFLAKDIRQMFGSAQQDRAERLGCLAQSTMECLSRSDALYHNLEHTMLVTMVGRDILRGRTMTERIEATDYDHLLVACLLHDIGYVRGVLSGDTMTSFVVDEGGKTVSLPRGRGVPIDAHSIARFAFHPIIGPSA